MFINKIGMEHLEIGMNCQDYGFEGERESVICDGCSEGKHSEVGAKLYSLLRSQNEITSPTTTAIFNKIVYNLLGDDPIILKNYMCFTILNLLYSAEDWIVNYCGDGYIILQDYNDNITFEELSDGEYPKYYIYNYIERKHLQHYKDGVSFSQKTYSQEKYAKVGIASDGLRYILRADEKLKCEFINCLKSDRELKTKLFINRNRKIFKDDITIVF